MTTLRITAWNENGLKNHIQEVILFLTINKIDILLVSESHTTTNFHQNSPLLYLLRQPPRWDNPRWIRNYHYICTETLRVRTLYNK
jgi:hypothetical protein